ncbi:hypothetical protein [Kitasatospora viridis]|uniref:Uncharacterized protein n=1 Tax=Kitasatospora viridis TaxID=281105 RepID=A0A561UML9_9ACTN|nr:hypothetical protein [Kitasatospora viridis]TWG00602.1 hypothetical protein FHX73_114482 [Kitasatospora viridis]
MHDPTYAPVPHFEDGGEDEDEGSTMTLRIYRIAADGAVVELAKRAVWRGESYWRGPIGGEWPPCSCPRCLPMLRSRQRRDGLARKRK